MDRQTIRKLTRLDTREFPEATYEFLRCQLGKYEWVKVQVSTYRNVTERVFRLIAFGETWDQTLKHYQKV